MNELSLIIDLKLMKNMLPDISQLEGDMAELGVFYGGSAKIISENVPHKVLHLFDTFDGLPYDDKEGKHKKGDFCGNLPITKEYLKNCNVVYHIGVFPETTIGIEEKKYCFVHLDADLYESTKAGIEYFWPRLVVSGILWLDDLGNPNTPGVLRAVKELLPDYVIDYVSPMMGYIKKPEEDQHKCNLLVRNHKWEELIEEAKNVEIESARYFYAGQAFYQTGRYEESLAAYEDGLKKYPKNIAMMQNLTTLYSALGRWKDFYRSHENRFTYWSQVTKHFDKFDSQKKWTGAENIEGKRVAVIWEQGQGDNIQWMRFAKILSEKYKCDTIVLGYPEFFTLLERQSYVDAFYSDKLPKKYDYWCPLLSLPYLMGLDYLPSDPYISVEKNAGMGSDRLNIGICWAGNACYAGDRNRSCPLKEFEPIQSLGNIISFQVNKMPRSYTNDPLRKIDLSEHPEEWEIFDLEVLLKDWLATAMHIKDMDVIVSVDTALLHMAGAMGKPAIGILPFISCWRWGAKETSTPWYPSIRLCRQDAPGDWASCLQKTANLIIEGKGTALKKITDGAGIYAQKLPHHRPNPQGLQ